MHNINSYTYHYNKTSVIIITPYVFNINVNAHIISHNYKNKFFITKK